METFSVLLAISAGNSPVPVPGEFPHKGQWRGALMFTLICARINGCVNNREAGDLRRYRTHYDVIVMWNGENIEQKKLLQFWPYPTCKQNLSYQPAYHDDLSRVAKGIYGYTT